MKVLVCIPCLLTGGTEVQTLSLVEALVTAGHQVCVAAYFEYAEGMVKRYLDTGSKVVLLSKDGSRPVGIKNTFKFLWDGLRKVVKDFKPDVAHVQYMAPGALPILILKGLGVKKIIATTHTGGDIYSKNGLRIIRLLSKTCLMAFQCITERAERSYFGDSHLFDGTIRKHFTIYNNIPSHIEILSEPRPDKAPNSPIYVGVVSRLEHIKGMDLVAPAFAKAAEENPDLRLLIVGDGSQRQLMERQVEELNIWEKAVFAGRQPQTALQGYYDRIDILLMPSRSEGFGLTAIEGMARGCVPIVANTGGLPEVVTAESGLLHAPEDVDSLANCITDLASDRELLTRMSAVAIRRAKVFSRENYHKAIKTLYDRLSQP